MHRDRQARLHVLGEAGGGGAGLAGYYYLRVCVTESQAAESPLGIGNFLIEFGLVIVSEYAYLVGAEEAYEVLLVHSCDFGAVTQRHVFGHVQAKGGHASRESLCLIYAEPPIVHDLFWY